MATVIRFSRHGTKKKPYFRIVVQDKTRPRDGKFIEHIGAFDPIKGDKSITIERDRLEYWLGTGALMSNSLENRLKVLRKTWETAGAGTTPPAAPKPKTPKKEKESATKEA